MSNQSTMVQPLRLISISQQTDIALFIFFIGMINQIDQQHLHKQMF